MSLTNIYNERYGTSVATNDNYVAVGNPPTHDYNLAEGFYRHGEVVLIKKNNFNSNYSASFSFTKSLHGKTINSTRFGESIDLSDYFLAIGNSVLSASVTSGNCNCVTITGSYVDVYIIDSNYNIINGSLINDETCAVENLNTQIYTNTPFITLTGSNSFGTSVSITNKYLAVGSPKENNGRGKVYVYQFSASKYKLEATLTPNVTQFPSQYGFGYSVSIDKKYQDKIVIGSNQLSHSNVYLYQSSSGGWGLKQYFSQVTGSLSVENSLFNWYPVSLKNSNYGHSVSIHDRIIVVGAPSDLVYYEYSGSTIQRQRGAFYVYSTDLCNSTPSGSYLLLTKLYGDENTFKDNFLGYSVSTNNNNIIVGSPKRYFPFSSVFLSSSLNFYKNIANENDFGASTFLGQVLYYQVTGSKIINMTSYPISKRKESENSPFSAYGAAVSIYGNNIAVGSPIPLLRDYYLDAPYITESGSISDPNYVLTSSYYEEGCDVTSSVVYFQIEQSVTTCAGDPIYVALCEETTPYTTIEGNAYVYNLSDLQTNFNVGNVFYNNNRVVINNTGSGLNLIGRNATDTNLSFIYMDYESLVQLHEKQYICTLEPGEFNISTNPTAITGSLINYGIVDKVVFDFNNLDLILRYINYNITSPRSEEWWTNMVSGDTEISILSFYSASYDINNPFTIGAGILPGSKYQENRLTYPLKCVLATKNFDVNGDGKVDFQDGRAIWKYFINNLTYQNYKNYINPTSRRNTYDGLIKFLDTNTGKGNKNYIKPEFFEFSYSSSIDPTGSYLAPYITQVGLYNGADLVAIAKLAQPIKNSGQLPINIAVKWDT